MSQSTEYYQDRINELEWRVDDLLEQVGCLESEVDGLTRELAEAKGELAKRMALDEHTGSEQVPG